jgi:hypothetical protein
LVELEGCESGAFVDGVAEDERLWSPWSALYVSLRLRMITADCVATYHFSHQPTLETSGVISKQCNIVNSRTKSGYTGTIPDDAV